MDNTEKRVVIHDPMVFLGTDAAFGVDDDKDTLVLGDGYDGRLLIVFPLYRSEQGARLGEATVRMCDAAIEALNEIRRSGLKRAAAEADAIAAS